MNYKNQEIFFNKSHNPYFNRWFSAINLGGSGGKSEGESHNPYFNRWFSAIKDKTRYHLVVLASQSLF